MRDGFLSAACGTPKLRLADCRWNAEQTFTMMRAAEKAGAAVLVLPRLGLTGATCGDLFRQESVQRDAAEALATVLEATRNLEVLTAVGLPLRFRGRLYDCAAVIQRGRVLGVVPFPSDDPAFAAPPETAASLPDGTPFGADLVFQCREVPDFTFGLSPADLSKAPGAAVLGIPSADPDYTGRDAWRRRLLCAETERPGRACLYAGAGEGESSADAVYGAHQMIVENGTLLAERRFDGGLLVSELDLRRLTPDLTGDGVPFSLTLRRTKLTRYVDPHPLVPEGGEQETLFLAALGLKRRMEATGSQTCVVGLSGGLDSTLALFITGLAMQMLDRPVTDIIAVTMPCFGTTDRTKSNAVLLAERMGATLRTVDVSSAVRGHLRDIGHDLSDHNAAYENAQARERTQVLMDIANDNRGLVVGTGDLSELALGWCTYNGDHMSMYAVNASIPKTQVRHLVAYLAREREAVKDILEDILDTPVSPELLPAVQGGQRTEDLVGPYELHDFFLYHMVRRGASPRKIYRLAVHALGGTYSREVIAKWLRVFCRRFLSQQFKRDCMPDGPRVGELSLSPRGAWRMPSDAAAGLWEAELDSLE